MRHKKDVTSEFKCKFYKHSGSPNSTTIAKFDEIVKIGGCIQLMLMWLKTLAMLTQWNIKLTLNGCGLNTSPFEQIWQFHTSALAVATLAAATMLDQLSVDHLLTRQHPRNFRAFANEKGHISTNTLKRHKESIHAQINGQRSHTTR